MGWPIVSWLAREPGGPGAPGMYLPANTPCPSGDRTLWDIPFTRRQRPPDDLGNPLPRAEGNDRLLGLAPEQRVLWLARDEAFATGNRERRFDLLRRPFAEADVASLSVPHRLAQGL